MRISRSMVAIALLACVVMTAGCAKKMTVTIWNHSQMVRRVTVTAPEGITPVGSVGPGGRLSHVLSIKTEDLPARCTYSAGVGSTQFFEVTEDTKSKLWFHITKDGRLVGPYSKEDVHVEEKESGSIRVTVPAGTVIE